MAKVLIDYKNSKTHYPSLDGLRGVAVISVILYHVFSFRLGWMGVDLFFVLSGFLITSILIDSKGQQNYFKNFYIKRLLRIFPLYYLTLVIYFLPFLVNHSDSVIKLSLPYFAYIQNIIFTVNNHWPVDSLSPLNHFWSLAIEEQFYMFFPFIIYFISNKKLPTVFVFMILAGVACRMWFFLILQNNVGSYVFTLCRIDSLLIGALACFYARKFDGIRIEYFYLLLALVVGIAYVSMEFSSPLFATIGYTVSAFFFACILIMSLSRNTYINKILSNSIARHFGKYSYGLYVFHHIYFTLISYMVVRHFEENTLLISLVPVITLILTYVTAIGSFHFFENPILKLKRRLVLIPQSI